MPLSLIGDAAAQQLVFLFFFFLYREQTTLSLAYNFVVYALEGGSNESAIRIELVPSLPCCCLPD